MKHHFQRKLVFWQQLFQSKIFLRQFLSFGVIIGLTFIMITFSLFAVTRMALIKQQLHLVESYRLEVSKALQRWTVERQYSMQSQGLYLSLLTEKQLYSSEIQRLFRKQMILDDNFSEIAIIDPVGNIINSNRGPLNIRTNDRQYFAQAIRGQSATTGFFISRITGLPVLAISQLFYVEQRKPYVLAGYIRLEKYREIVEDQNLGQLGHVYLVDKNGGILTESRFTKVFDKERQSRGRNHPESPAIQQVTDGKTRTETYRDFMGEPVLGSFQWLKPIQSGLIVEFKERAVLQPLHKLFGFIGLLTVGVILVGAGLAMILSLRIIQPIKQLIEATAEVSAQHYQPIELKTHSELDQLVSHFNQMQEAIRLREAELKQTNSILQDMALKDGLTEIYNHAQITKLLEEEFARHLVLQKPLTFLMLDIDHFKTINDTYGHPFGDRVLFQLAELLKANVRQGDYVGRYGGEEFAVILPETDRELGYGVAQRIRQNVTQTSFVPPEAKPMTISVGVCTWHPGESGDWREMVKTADQALYQAKHNGRNRVEFMPPGLLVGTSNMAEQLRGEQALP